MSVILGLLPVFKRIQAFIKYKLVCETLKNDSFQFITPPPKAKLKEGENNTWGHLFKIYARYYMLTVVLRYVNRLFKNNNS